MTSLTICVVTNVVNNFFSLAGPFLIRCATSGSKCLYWTVDTSSYCVIAISNKINASKFYVKASNNAKHPDEFYICYFDVDLSEHRKINTNDQFDETKEYVEPIPRYLQTPIDMFGHSPGPLQLGYHIKSRNTRLILVNGLRSHRQPPVSLSVWMSGREMCFIQCARRRQRKGYIAVTMDQFGGGYHTCCVHSKCNESQRTSFMLFQTVHTLETTKGRQIPAVPPGQYGIPDDPVCFPHRITPVSFMSQAILPSHSQPVYSTQSSCNQILTDRPRPDTEMVSGDSHCETSSAVVPSGVSCVPATTVPPLPPPLSPSSKPQPSAESSVQPQLPPRTPSMSRATESDNVYDNVCEC